MTLLRVAEHDVRRAVLILVALPAIFGGGYLASDLHAQAVPGPPVHISGTLRSTESRNVVRHARVIADRTISVESNEEGVYFLAPAPGRHRLEVQALGIAPYDTTVTLQLSRGLDFDPQRTRVTLAVVAVKTAVEQADVDPRTPDMSIARIVDARRYTMHIDWEGDRYEGGDVLNPVAPIDSLCCRERNSPAGPSEGLRATTDTFDPAGERSYYRWDQLVDGVRLIAPDASFRIRVIANDDLVEGPRVREYQPYGGIPVGTGRLVTVRQIALSETAYRYYLAR